MQTEQTTNPADVENADAAAAAAAEATNNDDAARAAAEEDAAFEAGYSSVTGEPVAADDGNQDDPNPAEQSQASDDRRHGDDFDAPGTSSDGATPPQYLTREEVDALFQERVDAVVAQRLKDQEAAWQQELRKVHGNFGSLKGRVEEITKPRQVQFNRLRENYPELVEDLVHDLGDAGGVFGGGAVDKDAILSDLQPEIEAKIAEATKSRLDELNERYLNFMSPGWESKVKSDEFGAWLGTLPPDEAKKLEFEDDPFVVADTVRRFDTWTSQQQEAAREAEAKAKRLAGAEPAGSGKGAMPPNRSNNDEAAFEAGFHSVRGGRR